NVLHVGDKQFQLLPLTKLAAIGLSGDAYKHGNRIWQPDRPSTLHLVKLFAKQLTPETAQLWLVQAGHTLAETDLTDIFPHMPVAPLPQPDLHATRLRLQTVSDQQLFGIAEFQQKLETLLQATDRPWVVSIDGMGGIGKTSLAHVLAHAMLSTKRFYDFGWVSAKQEEFLPEGVLRPIIQPALSVDTFVDTLLNQLDPTLMLTRTPDEKLAILTRWLKAHPYLIIVDNLETATDTQDLLPLLQKLANPTKFLLTTRFSLRTLGSNIHSHTLRGLNKADTYDFLRHEATVRGIQPLANASDDQLTHIYEVVGGNPLALKLVVGQLCVLPLPQVLDNLRQAEQQTIDELYIYIYWQAWEMLSEAGRQALVGMPLAQEGTFEDVMRESELDVAETTLALKELTTLSLVDVGGDLAQPRYQIHRLTETFLLNEVIKWQAL
ncbi:MAG: NB-ARC domain-containing protein, partial [Chloroflexota bacterium]